MTKSLINPIKFFSLGLVALCVSLWFLGHPVMASEPDESQEQANIQVIQDYYAAYAEGDLNQPDQELSFT